MHALGIHLGRRLTLLRGRKGAVLRIRGTGSSPWGRRARHFLATRASPPGITRVDGKGGVEGADLDDLDAIVVLAGGLTEVGGVPKWVEGRSMRRE